MVLLKRAMNGLKNYETRSLQFKMAINASQSRKQLELPIRNMVKLAIAQRVELVDLGPIQFIK